jgi:hypothetical protein
MSNDSHDLERDHLSNPNAPPSGLDLTINVRPPLSLQHLDRMTDCTGLIQHAIYSLPRRESGYTTDDNARALRLCTRLWSASPNDRMLQRVACFLSFLEHARTADRGFYNGLSYQREWLEVDRTDERQGDWQGQAILALCEVLASPLPRGFRRLASELIETTLPAMADLNSLRAQAYVVQGWAQLNGVEVPFHRHFSKLARSFANHLLDSYDHSRKSDWVWFEPRMTYANAVLPHALFDAERLWPGEGFHKVAESTFMFLDHVTVENGTFCPVGNSSWSSYGGPKSIYDQQPIEAATMAAAAIAQTDWRGNVDHAKVFRRAYAWFHGENSLRKSLVDQETGACCDGLQPQGVNQNQGAESTLAYLWTEMLQREIHREFKDFPSGAVAGWQASD